jgi:acyl-CoA synthetase (AMP-forming)/AMP-acid ligase II
VIVRNNGIGPDESEIIAHCKRMLTSYKCPKTVEFIDVMPKTSTGKPSKPALREWAGRRSSTFSPIS